MSRIGIKYINKTENTEKILADFIEKINKPLTEEEIQKYLAMEEEIKRAYDKEQK